MSGLTPYKSSLLDSEHIRVVRVAAGRWRDPIRCELIQRKLDDASVKHPYRALSYVWGSSSVTDTIFLGGLAFKITLNLSCALRHLRKADEDIFLWVDALCINQEDHQERSLQVKIMQLIYRKAEEVVVFMGDGRDHRVSRSELMRPPTSPKITLHSHERRKSFLTEALSRCHFSGTGKVKSSLTPADCAIVLVSLFSDQDSIDQGCLELMRLTERTRYYLFECLRAYITCQWWSRIWVVQEIAVGTTITVQYGTITLPWDALVITANVWSLPMSRQTAASMGVEQENLKVFTMFANQLNGLDQTRRKWRAEGGDNLVRLLQEFSDRHATDDRDKVYGLLSLVKQEQRYIEPNYELDVRETYRATALALIGKGGSLACWAGDQKRKFNRGLPSWIPDWSTAVDTGDKRRMDLFDSYTTNGDWTLRVIEGEREYWDTVKDEMELLLNSPAARSGKLPASLGHFVHLYIKLLKQRAKSLEAHRAEATRLERWGLNSLPWALWYGITQHSIRSCLSWCVLHCCYLDPGISLLHRWVYDLEALGIDRLSEDSRPEIDKPGKAPIRRSLLRLNEAVKEENRRKGIEIASHAIYEIESIVLGLDKVLGTEINLAIQGVIDRCWKLLDKCKATDGAISPAKLFRVSYSLRGTASWLTDTQYKRAELDDWGPGLLLCTYKYSGTSYRGLPIQTVVVDLATWRGPRHFGWADAESGLGTLIFWLYFSGAVVVNRRTNDGEVKLNHERIRQFAKTIIGGMYRCDGSYREATDTVLNTLENWLQQCLTVDRGGDSGWELPDQEKGGYTSFGSLSWSPANERYGSGWAGGDYQWAHAAMPSEEWVRKSLTTNGFPMPPTTLFEDIQIATDGRVFFLTENGSMGLGPASMRNQDVIHVLPSGNAHFVLRSERVGSEPPKTNPLEWFKALDRDDCELVGDCYLHTDAAIANNRTAGEEESVEGSLPFELLGAQYLENMLPKRQTVFLH